MLKKIILGIVALLLLVGAEKLLAVEKKDKPKAKQKQEQVQKGQKKQASKAKAAAAARKRMEARRGKPQQLRPGQVRSMQEGSGRLLDELTKAYRENDREKMGQLIRKMHQLRQRVRTARGASGQADRGFRGRSMRRPGQGFRGGGWGRSFQGRGMGGPMRGFRGRGMGQGFPRAWCPNPRCPWMNEPEPKTD